MAERPALLFLQCLLDPRVESSLARAAFAVTSQKRVIENRHWRVLEIVNVCSRELFVHLEMKLTLKLC